MNKYRPIALNKKHRIHVRVKMGRTECFTWRSRTRWYPAGWRLNRQTLGRIFSQLHYLGCHAPVPLQKKWRRVYNQFTAKYLASRGKASVRYLNAYTAHKWL